jgi:hypothetical protein
MVRPAAGKEKEVMSILLDRRGEQLKHSDELLNAAAGSRRGDKAGQGEASVLCKGVV